MSSRLVFLAAAAALLPVSSLHAALMSPASAITVSKSVDLSRFPNANTVILESEQNVEVNEAGGYVRRSSNRVKVLTEEGRRDSLSMSLRFNRSYGYAKLLSLRLIKADGRVVELDPEKQSAEQQDPSSATANIYDPNDRRVTVSIPGVEIGDILETRVEEAETKPRMKGCFSDITLLESDVPTLRMRYTVNTPKSLPLVRTLIKGGDEAGVRGERREEGDRLIYSWETGETPQLLPEPSMPSLHLSAKRLLVSTVPDWKTVSRWYWEISKPHYESTPDIKAKVAELVAGAADREERLRRVYRFVSQEIRYMGITTETEAPGYEPHDVTMTFGKRYGVCRDKAALLAVMLREAGFESYPVLIMAGGDHLDPEVALPYFNHAITAVREADGSYRLMDSTDENTKDIFPGYLSNCSYLVAHPEGETLRVSPVPDAGSHLLTGATRIRVRADGGATGELDLDFNGMTDTVYRAGLAQARPEDVRRMVQQKLAAAIPGARVESVTLTPEQVLDTTKPLALRVRFDVPEFVTVRDGKAFVRTPQPGSAFGIAAGQLHAATALEKRRFPIKLSHVSGVSETVRIELPGNFRDALALPDDVAVRNDAFSYTRTLKRDGAVLTGASDLRIRALDIPASGYEAMRTGLRDIQRAGRKSALFSVSESESPDSRVLRRKVVFEFKDAHAFEMRVEERRRILTYAGKKDNAEVKLSWNAADPEPNLLHAVVRDKAGVDHAVTPAEINVLDAGWVAAAPRYTPSRTKVISLPCVDEGAEIDVAFTVARAGLPSISWENVFADPDAVDADEVEIIAPEELALYFLNKAGATAAVSGGRLRLTAKRAISPSPREAHASAESEWAPSMRVSTLRDESALAVALKPVLGPKSEPDATVRRKAAELTAGLTGEVARVRALRDFVAKSVREAGPEWGEISPAGFSGAARTLADGYGAAPDRAMLFCALLRAAGFDASPALYATGEYAVARRRDGEPMPAGFYDTLGVRVKLRDGVADFEYLDQYADPLVSATPGARVLSLESGRAEAVTARAGLGNAVSDRFRIELSDSGAASVHHSRVLSGEYAAGFTRRMEEMTPEDRSRFRQETLTALARDAKAGSEFTARGGQPGTLSYDAEIPEFMTVQGRYAYFDLPSAPGELFSAANEPSRRLPYAVATSQRARRVWDVRLPKGWRLAGEPKALTWDGPAGVGAVALRFSESTESDGSRRLLGEFEVKVRPGDVSPAAYPALVELNRRLKSSDTWRVLLERE